VSAKAPSAGRKTMKQILPSFRIFSDIALLAWAADCASTQSKENSLAAAGFRVIVPKTAAQQQKLKCPSGQGNPWQREPPTDKAHPFIY
jgi:hypothetical protein